MYRFVFKGLACAMLLGCGVESPPSPSPLTIAPSQVFRGIETSAVVQGSDFFNRAYSPADDPAGAEISKNWTVRLGAITLPQVTWVSVERIDVVVPGTLDPGRYDVTVVSPRGVTGIIPDGLRVVDPGSGTPLDPPMVPTPPLTFDLIVTTEVDELDPGETGIPPHLGAGLSLREAIDISNTMAGKQTIGFIEPGPMVIVPTSNLPALTDPDGTDIFGDSRVTIDGRGLAITGNSTILYGLEIANVAQTAVSIQGTGNEIWFSVIHDASTGVRVRNSADVPVIAKNRFYDLFEAVWVQIGNPVYVFHNTIDSCNTAVSTGPPGAIEFENNIVTGSVGDAFFAAGSDFAVRDYNVYFGNGGLCSGCTPGPNGMELDPLYMGGTAYMLDAMSPAIDNGREIPGFDANGIEPGSYNGSAPDIGAYESP